MQSEEAAAAGVARGWRGLLWTEAEDWSKIWDKQPRT